ncbi:hypothetical protein B0T26DRAFT_670135 [Lasiosphaeria miniovina]|uniref:Uncharacterized protein n=1 Tax=Lasiosphaeria miniovina TaxID=1954250 RepID=A0AA40EBD6_9PEZI|nr:uncharacterized protein B0T26DRAFT_670135 [Lasiosphaeria miniovina]KAK0733760.1 hypothetical protein B0T26DRAFT_670135 [Lasiosphaeria miniovina]
MAQIAMAQIALPTTAGFGCTSAKYADAVASYPFSSTPRNSITFTKRPVTPSWSTSSLITERFHSPKAATKTDVAAPPASLRDHIDGNPANDGYVDAFESDSDDEAAAPAASGDAERSGSAAILAADSRLRLEGNLEEHGDYRRCCEASRSKASGPEASRSKASWSQAINKQNTKAKKPSVEVVNIDMDKKTTHRINPEQKRPKQSKPATEEMFDDEVLSEGRTFMDVQRFFKRGNNIDYLEKDTPWECCGCLAQNSRFEFLCSGCHTHSKCSGCERIEDRNLFTDSYAFDRKFIVKRAPGSILLKWHLPDL